MQRTLLLLLGLGACASLPDSSVDEAFIDGSQNTNFCRTVTVSGTMYYNDLRTNGRFTLRDREPGWYMYVPGVAPGSEPYGTGDNSNYYGLRDAQVDIYEVDRNYNAGAAGCSALTHAGTTTINQDGTYSWTGQVCETCGADDDGGQNASLSIAVKVSLRNCTDSGTRCFSVANPHGAGATNHFDDNWGGSTWTKWADGATDTAPYITAGTNVPLAVDRFEVSTVGQTARAANIFASLVDVTRKVHVQLNVPFGHPEVVTYFPSSSGTVAHSHESGRICVPDGGDGTWIDGREPAHEYGHLLHFWEWGGYGKWVSYSYDSDGDGHIDTASDSDGDGVNDVDVDGDGDLVDETAESTSTREWNNAAFKEGWANFIAGVTFDGTGSPRGCDLRTTTHGATAGTITEDGKHWIDDVQVALCEVWDNTAQTVRRNGIDYRDNSNFTLNEMLDGLGRVWNETDYQSLVTSATQSNPLGTNVLGVCALMGKLYDSDPALPNALAVIGLDCDL